MADMIILMKTMEHFATPKKTKAQLEAEKLLKEEEERQAKMKHPQAKGTPAAPAKAPAAPAKAPSAPSAKAPAVPAVPAVAPKKDDDKKGVVKKVLEKFKMDDDGAVAGISISGVIWWLFFFLAAYLSWTCNSKNSPGMDMVEKALRACVAGFFWLIYLILYLLIWADQCKTKKV